AGLYVRHAGTGAPVLVLHHDAGSPERLPFYDALAREFTAMVPSHPGYDKSERPAWLRNVRDVAAVHQWLLSPKRLTAVSLVGLGFGGWIAAEMASLAPRVFSRLILVGAMGIKPERSDIADQALVSYIDYVKMGFADLAAYARVFGAEPPTETLEQW